MKPTLRERPFKQIDKLIAGLDKKVAKRLRNFKVRRLRK
jgi:hypothetical protein